ncbi:WD repeat and FYVE domain-containing protein 3 isoform X2 [Condylostylus longicornis]|uniref:WD repeat and FYVE domain-containing protein 3 isoform X2 n=1 Tax=Condylostylus longicornis TaxID=2530218 RepID=UPI00244DF84F|nr:WD repeat and FYVE domain-containing protein 3 isoform X2 [Condylostylus longicornis]
MNVMRKLRGVGGGTGPSNIAAGSNIGSSGLSNINIIDDSSGNNSSLSLMHLKKLFNEYTHPKEALSEHERDMKLYNMLPLFCKVFSASPASDMSEKFWDCVAFCQQVSRLMVAEIRKRASNQSTEAASIAIVKFLEIENCEESSSGWMLLSTLNILANGDVALIQVMTSAAVPSTLVKCLYLFFDLPEIENQPKSTEDSVIANITTSTSSDNNIPAINTGALNEFSPVERRTLLQKVFVQLLVKLCSYPYPAEELSRMDDLTLLFSAITSQCSSHNTMWRKSAAEVLTTLSRHGLTEPVVNYIHSKSCMALCVENMQRPPESSPLEVVEMFVTVFCFLKDSSRVSQVLLDDFRASQGYVFLSDFLLKLESDRQRSIEVQAAIRNLVLMISSLCMCGYNELRPIQNQTNTLFKMQNFQMPQVTSRETCVRNIHAFQVLQTVFLKSTSSALCCTILDAISSVYHSDNANYFILDSENTLSQFTERIHIKGHQIQEKFFDILEFIVFQLNFVPCKELISLSLLLKNNHSNSCSILCLKTLLNILRHNAVFKEVYREVGLLEVFVACLDRYSDHVKKITNLNEMIEVLNSQEDQADILGKHILEALQVLLNGNNNNANIFRESGGAKCIHELVKFKHCRPQALGIIRELILSTGGDDDMLSILSQMHSVPAYQVEFKIQILNMLLGCLKDSHRTRTVFRKVGGFVYLTSVFVSLDGKLNDGNNKNKKYNEINQYDLLLLLQMVCQTLVTAMRFEPANAKFFHHEICNASLVDTLKLLGCFTEGKELGEAFVENFKHDDQCLRYFHELFTGEIINSEFNESIPKSLSYACIVYRLLYNISLDNFEKPNLNGAISLFPDQHIRSPSTEFPPGSVVNSNHINFGQQMPDPRIVHPGVVISMLQLLPSIKHEDSEKGLNLQLYLAEIIKSLVRSERNQQIMCDYGLAGCLLKIGKKALAEEKNALHVPLQYILERLAAQALQPTELREFLRLGDPLSCADINLTKPYKLGDPVPLTRIKTLVSMTTPRDFRAHGSSTLPPFVELDMSVEGFGCIYLPSLAPQAPNTGGTIDANTIGGIGTGDRIFPPQTGLSYTTWFCVEKFSDPKIDPHCVRLLTLVRTINNPREENLVCLSILLSAADKAIVVSTQETLVTPGKNIGDWEPEGSDDCNARIWCPDLHEGQWHNLVVVLNRAVLKNSSLSLYLDGAPMHTQKLHYISQNPGAGSVNLAIASQVYGYVGTPPIWRRYSRLCWKQGVCHLVEDVLNQQTVQTVYALGPHYMGSLQAPQLGKHAEPLPPLAPEERVLLGLNAKAMTQMTLAKIRKVYSRTDNKSIAKQLGMNSHENATPIKILHNSAGHLAGPGRCLGGVVVGYLGVRVFSPHPVSAMIDTVGGCNVLLGIIAMAKDVESLYAGVKALTCVVKSNRAAQNEMDRKRSYQTLGMFFKKKKNLLNSHILHLTFGLVGTVNSGQEMSAIPNITAFQDLLCDLEIWHGAPNGLLRSLLEHLLELAIESNEKRQNIKIMRELQLVSKLLHIIVDINDHSTREILFNLIETLLGQQPKHNDLLLFGQYIAAKLPRTNCSERAINVPVMIKKDKGSLDQNDIIGQNVYLRNRCLSLLHGLLFTPRNTVNYVICDDISKILGMDWLLLFMQPQVHFTTVIIAVRILVVVCANESFMVRFRDATHNGGYLKFTELISQKKSICLGATQLSGGPASNGVMQANLSHLPSQIAGEVKTSVLHIPGFQMLEWLLQHHLDVPELYFLITALIMGQPVKLLASEHTKFDLDRVWAFLWGAPVSHASASSVKVNVCPEAVCVLLGMVRAIVHISETIEWLYNHPETIIQVLFSLYHNLPDFMPTMMSGDVITSLVAVLFPFPKNRTISEEESALNSGTSTPDDTNSGNCVLIRSHNVSVSYTSQLTQHSVRKFVIDFLRVIVVDSLSLSMHGKSTPVIDLVLDASPESAEIYQQIEFQTEIVTALMEHLLAADVLVGEQAALPIVPLLQSHVQNIAPNVFYFTARVVDKMWQGCLTKNPHEVFDFIIKLIAQAKKRSSALSLEQLHHSLNRTILYLLSRPTDSITDQTSVLEALHKIITNRLLIFGAGNHELEFIACLTYCLMQLTSDMKIVLEPSINRATTWHVNPQNEDIEPRDDQLNQLQGRNLIVGASFRVWEELYVCKKPAIEEVFKVSLTVPINNFKAPDLQTTREQVMELASKLWFNYVDAERKASYRIPWEIHNQIQSKIQKVTGGLTRLASRTKVKKEELVRVKSTMSKGEAFGYTGIHVQLIKDLWEMRVKQHMQMLQHTQRYVYQDWILSETELTRERGLWGSVKTPPLDKWMLDSTEGPHRMRKKTMKNDIFYLQYPYRPEIELPDNRQLKYKVATSLDSKIYFTYCHQQPRILCETDHQFPYLQPSFENITSKITNKQSSESNTPPQSPTDANNENTVQKTIDGVHEDAEEEEEEDMSMVADNQTFLRLLEEQEKISYMFRCARIQGLDTTEGLLLFGKEHCYIVDGFTLLKNRDIRDIDTLPPGAYEPIIPNSGGTSRCAQKMRQCSKFSYEEIREVHKRRYLLQPIALEVFSEDGRNYLLSFPRKVRNKVYQRFLAHATAINDNAQQSVAGQKRTASVEQSSGIFSSLIGETSVTQRWVRGEISNFQYLMHLNTLAGRSYNDLMQYPVFPWILADYDSEELDLANSKTFRDFSKPMGAQSEERLEQFQKRYKEWDDPHGETPPYHYGTHYSSAMIVCSYLVRLEPFTQHFLRLQGGHFDLADRMFHSIKEAWLSASKFNMADVKELIPEFFYLPEFLTNSNNFDLGTKQNGDTLNHVVLPPWAKQDTREFIRMHRNALECDYVSQNLHLWIDLIFGCKQQGPPAVEAVNVFHHLFYEGNVDIYNIEDPLKKNATIGFINNFGQIPKQLFKKNHPAKKMGTLRHSVIDSSSLINVPQLNQTDKLFFHNLDNLKPSLQPIKELKGPVGQILQPDKTVLAVEQNKIMMPQAYTRYIAWGFADHSLRVGIYDSDKALFVCEAAAQNSGEILACACPNSKMIVTAGTSSVVTIWKFDVNKKTLTVRHNLHGHTDAVTCLAASPAYNVIVSGSRDGTAIVWDMSRFTFVRQLRGHVGVVAAVAINDLSGDIATCSATWLHVWSINGDALANVNTSVGSADRMQQILCVSFSETREWDQQNVIITGSTDGVVRMWSMEYVQVPIFEKKLKRCEELCSAEKESLEKGQDAEITEKSKKINLFNKIKSLSGEENEIVKSASESSLSEACDASDKSLKSIESEKRDEDDNEEGLSPLMADSERRKSSIAGTKSLHELKSVSVVDERRVLDKTGSLVDKISAVEERTIRPSKSDTSLTESFVVIDNDGKNKTENLLRKGFKWQQQLVFRSKLTMHTAYDRKDNAEPASITALTVSKDHKIIYVGDARGRIFSWSVSEQPGRGVADHWLKDEGADQCVKCRVKFNLYERKHHCRNCGQVFCNKCSRFESEISRLKILKPVRVCQQCYGSLRSASIDH